MTCACPAAGAAGGRQKINGRQVMTLIGRQARRPVAAALAVAGAVLAVTVTSGAPASAATSAVSIGTIACSGNTLTVHAPAMYRVRNDGLNENAYWWPQLQYWTGNGWAPDAGIPGRFLDGVILGNLAAGGWANATGTSVGGSWTWRVTPGYSYRVVNWVEWGDMNGSAMLAGWYGPYTSTWSTNAQYTWCTF